LNLESLFQIAGFVACHVLDFLDSKSNKFSPTTNSEGRMAKILATASQVASSTIRQG